MNPVKVQAGWCVHDDHTHLAASLSSFDSVHECVVFVSKVPWFGDPGDWETSVSIAALAGAKVVVGEWPDESLHRRAALDYMKAQGAKFLLIPDTDEVVQRSLLDHLVKLAEVDAVDSVRCRMQTFWYGPNYVIRPVEELAPLIMLKLEQAEHIHIREYETGPRGLTLSDNFGSLLHLSYAGSDARILRKISSWGHRTEVQANWFEDIFKKWSGNRTMANLHPTHPPCYGVAERIQIPPELAGVIDERESFGCPPLPKRWPSVSVVIPLYGGAHLIRNCLESLSGLKDLIHETIVVDDRSPDDAAKVVEEFEWVTLIRNEENLGFGPTCNRGFEASAGEVVVFLNSDTVVTRAGFIRLMETLTSSGTTGAAGPMSNHVGYHQATHVTYSYLSNLDLFAQDFAYREADDFEVDMLVGFCLAVKRAVLEEVGLFDPRFKVGMWEDADLCYRMRRAGYRLKVSSRAFVHHEGSASLLTRDEHPIQLLSRNREEYLSKWQADLRTGFASHLSGLGGARIVFNPDRDPAILAKETARKAKLADISLCLIVKDEQRVIRACLESAKPYFSQMVVVDTGSSDCTAEIAQEMGAEVYHFPWTDSFSEARNESLKHARGKWIFVMDADDVLPPECGEHLLDCVLNAPNAMQAFVVPVRFVEQGPGGTQVDHVKLFPNLPGLAYRFRIHEQILENLQEHNIGVARSNAFVLHSGYDTSPEGQARKRVRDYRLLKLDLEENPEHPFVLFNWGMTDHFTAQHETAVDWLERSIIASHGQGSQLRKAYALLAVSQRELGRMSEALRTLASGIDAVGEDPELRFQMGVIFASLGRFEEAKLQYLAMTGGDPGYFSSVNTGIFGALREHNLGVACHGLGDYAGARDWWLKALAHRPLHVESMNALWQTATQYQDFRTLQLVLEIVREASGEGELWGSLGASYAQTIEGEAGPERFFQRVLSQNPQASGVRILMARLLLSQRRVGEAYPHLVELTRNGVAEAYDHLSVLAIRQGDYRQALDLIRGALNLDPSNDGYRDQEARLREAIENAA